MQLLRNCAIVVFNLFPISRPFLSLIEIGKNYLLSLAMGGATALDKLTYLGVSWYVQRQTMLKLPIFLNLLLVTRGRDFSR